jgi:hypothetical protein
MRLKTSAVLGGMLGMAVGLPIVWCFIPDVRFVLVMAGISILAVMFEYDRLRSKGEK